ncbi:hypothetical protein SBA4_1190019 [Candidatus Sulfopaludibacter sp. SbA4]|nr:hypothetical protein SBA4_1190019 [Candidatus Sulfopaludibacter sp. SbA4]
MPACSLAAGTNATRSATTNEAGAYSFSSLAPGTYTLRAEKPGFKTLVRSEIELQVQQAARIDLGLEVGQVENGRIVDLPLNGRNYLHLVSLAPDVSTGFSGRGQAASTEGGIRASETMAAGGRRTSFNHYTLDGVENTDPNSGLQRGETCA